MAQILSFKAEYKGISSAEAEERLSMYGLNVDNGSETEPYSLKKAMLTPRFFTQIIAVILLFLTKRYVEGAVMLLLCVIITVGDVIWQLRLYEKDKTLKRLTGMKFRVIRNGELTLVRKEYLVPDDIIVLQGGERVPADAHLLETDELLMNEEIFSGDSTPVPKKTGSDGGKTLPKSTCIYKNTLVVSGSLVARVFATGEDVAIKRRADDSVSVFEQRIKKPAAVIMLTGVVLMAVMALLCALRIEEPGGYADIITRVAVPALAVGMCFIPNGADKLIRSFYLGGASMMNRRHALIKNIVAEETLSAVTCLCVEKSGTITKNHIEVADVFTEERKLFNNVCVLACEPAPVDSAEKAILLYSTFSGVDVKDLFSNEREAVYPFREDAKMAGSLWKIGGQRLLCIKGSPEEVLAICNIEPNELHYIQQKRQGYAKQGRQVLAVAFSALDNDAEIPQSLTDIRYEYMGLVALENTTRDTVPYAVKSCIKSGVRVIMITGDNEETAAAVGRQIGIQSSRTVIGSELIDKPDLTGVGIFAKILPSQRMEVLRLLREQGEMVAWVGTDTDDIGLLEEADVGISVSGTASPAAAESCDMLMGDDNLLAVADAVKSARQVHRNLKSALGLMLSAHVSLALISAIAIIFGESMLITPILAVLLTCIVFPVAASMFIGNTADSKSDFTSSEFIAKGVINNLFFPKVVILGTTLTMAITLFHLFTMDLEVELQRSFLFIMMTAGLVLEGMTLVSRKKGFITTVKEKHGFSGAMQAGLLLLISLVLIYVPFLNTSFGFGSPNVLVMLIALVVTLLFTFWPEAAKRFNSMR
ncbi:MAG: HAD family hydrolase [Firmicutes bacterium]|nr:HAD family hydrolase [[Eubacterium] siraeum]MCM1488387.1 HAD family hydrolase [Bacillota bacterium]